MTNRNHNMNLLSRRRIRLAELAVTAGCLIFCGMFSWKYVIHPAVSDEADALQHDIINSSISSYRINGSVVDRTGETIYGSSSAGAASYAEYPLNYSYAYLLGYYTVDSGQENTYGLLGNLNRYLYYKLDDESTGSTVKLTTENSLQNYCYQLLNGNEGSITVIDNDSGAILALASESGAGFNVNDLDTLFSSDAAGAQYRRGTYENDPPGSTFKVVTAAAALKKAKEENLGDDWWYYYDTGSYIPEGSGFSITNFNMEAWGDLDLESALNNSVNCYFANLGIQVGEDAMKEMASKFMIGKEIEIPFLDTLTSDFELNDGTPVEIAQASFGQGDTQITPVHIAMIAQAIANNGVMMKPYIVQSITCGNILQYTAFTGKLSTCIDLDVDRELKSIMHSTAEGYGLTENTYGMVYAKTGTAECAGGRVHTYLMGFTEDASFCISMNNGDYSSNLYPIARNLVSFINSLYH